MLWLKGFRRLGGFLGEINPQLSCVSGRTRQTVLNRTSEPGLKNIWIDGQRVAVGRHDGGVVPVGRAPGQDFHAFWWDCPERRFF